MKHSIARGRRSFASALVTIVTMSLDTSLKTFRTQLDPTSEQAERFEKWSYARTGVFNWGLSMRQHYYEEKGETKTLTELDGMLTPRKQRGALGVGEQDPPRRVLYYSLKDLDEAYQHFFRRLSNGETPGHPKRQYPGDNVRFSVYGSDCKYKEGAIKLPCIDDPIPYEEEGYVPTDASKYSRVTVSKDEDRWMVSVQCYVDNPIDTSRLCPEVERPEIIAVHPGVRIWLALQERGSHPRQRALPIDRMFDLMSRIDRQHQTLSRKEPGSNNWERARSELAITYRKLRHLREDRTHKATARLCYDIRPRKLIIQDWDMSHLMEQDFDDMPNRIQREIKRRMQNANIGELKAQLKYKARWADVEVMEIPKEVEVSKRCSNCLEIDEDLGGKPTYNCSECDHVADREVNALQNYWLEHESGNTTPVES